jgi:hypothetical protein
MGGLVGSPGSPQSCPAPTVEEHHHLFWGTRPPQQHGGGWRTTAHHRPHCHQHAAASRADRWGAGLNVISHAAFKKLQIPGSWLGASCPFFGVGPQPVYPLGSIALPVTFGTEENFRTENVQFDIAEVNLPFNAIIGRPTLYRFMAIAHYGYLVLKMPSPAGVLTVRGDRTATLAVVEKLHALAVETTRSDGGGRSSSASIAKATKVQPTEADSEPVKTIWVGIDPSRTTHIAGNLGE